MTFGGKFDTFPTLAVSQLAPNYSKGEPMNTVSVTIFILGVVILLISLVIKPTRQTWEMRNRGEKYGEAWIEVRWDRILGLIGWVAIVVSGLVVIFRF